MIGWADDNDEGDLYRTVGALTNATCMLAPLPRSCLFPTADQSYITEFRSVLGQSYLPPVVELFLQYQHE